MASDHTLVDCSIGDHAGMRLPPHIDIHGVDEPNQQLIQVWCSLDQDMIDTAIDFKRVFV